MLAQTKTTSTRSHTVYCLQYSSTTATHHCTAKGRHPKSSQFHARIPSHTKVCCCCTPDILASSRQGVIRGSQDARCQQTSIGGVAGRHHCNPRRHLRVQKIFVMALQFLVRPSSRPALVTVMIGAVATKSPPIHRTVPAGRPVLGSQHLTAVRADCSSMPEAVSCCFNRQRTRPVVSICRRQWRTG